MQNAVGSEKEIDRCRQRHGDQALGPYPAFFGLLPTAFWLLFSPRLCGRS